MPRPPDHVPDGVPANVATLLQSIGIIDEELVGDDANEMLEALRRGFCMTCGCELGEQVVILVNNRGIVAGYCSGPCLQDQAVLGWIQEQHDDIVDSINFRGGKGDEPIDTPEG